MNKGVIQPDRKAKTVFSLESPYSSTTWPIIASKDQDTIVELLCNLLSPIGHHRTNHISKSKGKRSKKRKRAEAKATVAFDSHIENASSFGAPLLSTVPPPPELLSSLTIGFNSITRHLEALSLESLPKACAAHPRPPNPSASQATPTPHLAAIFVPRDAQPPLLHAHLPTLTVTASLSNPTLPQTRLVSLPKAAESKMMAALGLPCVGFVGLMESAPNASSLVDFVREHVSIVEAAWLKEVRAGVYLPVNINMISTTTPLRSKTTKDDGTEAKHKRL
ncbi:MAG: hypothetical protein M1812_001248 [Candelaria pacifica]|nr:MAG: hypothetical protein M1812_001248 [Candelaria pacifica]